MIDEKFDLLETIDLIESSFKEIYKFVSTKASSISSILNEFNRAYKVVTDWSIDPAQDPMLVYVTIYIDVDRRRAFVDKLYAKDLARSIDAKSLISKCDESYRRYFVD
jgi:hypothetical protein